MDASSDVENLSQEIDTLSFESSTKEKPGISKAKSNENSEAKINFIFAGHSKNPLFILEDHGNVSHMLSGRIRQSSRTGLFNVRLT